MIVVWPRIVDNSNAYPPDVWNFFLNVSPTALGEKGPPVFVGHDGEAALYGRGNATVATAAPGG